MPREKQSYVNNPKDSKPHSEAIDIKAIFFKAINAWYLFVIGLMISGVYSWYKVRYSVPVYAVDARLLVKDEYSSWGQEYFLPGMELVSSRNRLINEVGILKSFPLILQTIEELDDFKVFYYRHGNIKVSELYKSSPFKVEIDTLIEESVTSRNYYVKILSDEKFELSGDDSFDNAQEYRFGQPIDLMGNSATVILRRAFNPALDNEMFSFRVNQSRQLAKFFQNTLSVVPENKESSILLLGRRGTQINKEIDFINKLIEVYIRFGLDQSNQIATNTLKFVDEQIEEILDTLIISEMQLQQFKSDINVSRLTLEDQSTMNVLAELEQSKWNRTARIEVFNELLDNLGDEQKINTFVLPAFISENNMLNDNLRELRLVYKEKNDFGFELTKDNDRLLLIEQREKELKRDIVAGLKQTLYLENRELDDVNNQISIIESRLQNIPKAEREYVNIQRKYQLSNDLYTYLLKKRSEAGIARASNISKAQVLDYADNLRIKFVGPSKASMIMMPMTLGFVIPFLLVFLADFFNTKIIDKKDLSNLTSIPVVGTIGHNKYFSNLIVLENPKSVIAEGFRSLRTNISFLTEGKSKYVVSLTSSISGEGKTFCGMNLSLAQAQLGKKTLLVGADLRKPKIYDDFELENKVGLSNYLIKTNTLEEVVQKTKLDNLDVITSGIMPPNPSELLASVRMHDFIEEVKKVYDVIIIDTPPVGLVTDALLINKFVDVSLYLVRQGFTTKSQLMAINDYYEKGSIQHIGIVVNDVKQRKIGYGGYYGYGYGYGYYSSYYGEDKKRDSWLDKIRNIRIG